MYIKNYEETRTTKDIVGYIRGAEEPDKYIILELLKSLLLLNYILIHTVNIKIIRIQMK